MQASSFRSATITTRRARYLVSTAVASLFLAVLLVSPAAGAHSDPEIISALDETGRYLELSTDSELTAAIDRANSNGVAFAWLDQGGDDRVAFSLADDYVEDLDELGSRYQTVVVLLGDGYAASSYVYSESEYDPALDAAFEGFRAGAIGKGLEAFNDSIEGALSTTATTTGGSNSGSGSGSSGGIGFGSIIVLLALLVGAFLLFRAWRTSRKNKKQQAVDMEADRAEIKEQLKNNADRVISLGDRVIAKADQSIIARYEEASRTYQEVSQSVEAAATPEEVDALDDRIDHAEWQLEAIEAELDGRPEPPVPVDDDEMAEAVAKASTKNAPPAPSGRRSDDRSVITSPRTGRDYRQGRSTRRRSRGGMGGGLGGGLAGILANIVLGGGGSRSRRSQRRGGLGGGLGDILGGGGLGQTTRRGQTTSRRPSSGGLGGGVLQRGGSSGRRSASRSRSNRRGGGRSTGGGRSRRGGGRKF